MVAAMGWVGTLLIARHLSLVDFGAFSFIFNLLGLLGLLADFQTSRIVVREVIDAGDDLEPVVGSFVTFRVALGALTYAVAVAFVLIGNYPRVVVQGTLIGGLSFFVASATWALVTVSQARLWLRTVAISMVVAQAVQLIAIVALVVSHSGSLLRFVVPFVVYDVVTLVWMLVAFPQVVRVRPTIEPSRWLHWLKEAAPLAIGSTLGTIYFRIDGVMLSKLGDLKRRRRLPDRLQVLRPVGVHGARAARRGAPAAHSRLSRSRRRVQEDLPSGVRRLRRVRRVRGGDVRGAVRPGDRLALRREVRPFTRARRASSLPGRP